MVYVFRGREKIFINQNYLPYFSCISILMLWSGFTSLSELKDTPLEWYIYRLFDDFTTPLCLVGK